MSKKGAKYTLSYMAGDILTGVQAATTATTPLIGHLVSLAYLKRARTERMTRGWIEEVRRRRGGTKAYPFPPQPGAASEKRPSVRRQLRAATKGVAASHHQLLSGHTLLATRLKDKWG